VDACQQLIPTHAGYRILRAHTMKKLIARSAITLAAPGANHTLASGLWLNEVGDFFKGEHSGNEHYSFCVFAE
ncbi:MAG: hypothetical protein V7700_00715, partial [Halioglobus sp.]